MTIKKYTKPQENLFIVSRTSYYNRKPCDEAFKVEIMGVDRRAMDDPKKSRQHGGSDSWWYAEGSNHRVENGEICRDMEYVQKYGIQFYGIVDIINFIDKYGECVISRDSEGFCTIEIYDDYRE